MFTILSPLSFDNTYLSSGLDLTATYLRNFASRPDAEIELTELFGSANPATLTQVLQDWSEGNFELIPPIEILSASQLNGANGAFSAQTNRIYLSDAFIASATAEGIANVLLEEIGHAIDSSVNTVDTAGDEGAIFAALVQGENLDADTLQAWSTEDDTAYITLNGQAVQIEQNTTILKNATGDGSLEITVDEFGRFGSSSVGGKSAFYDPLGTKVSSSTTYRSFVALGIIGSNNTTGLRTELNPLASNNEVFTNSNNTTATSTFTINGLQFELKQLVQDTFNNTIVRTGSRLDQTYTITNITGQTINFDLVRYVDGDLLFDGSLIDGGGRIAQNGQEILFETDSGGTGQTDTTFFGILGTGGTIPTTNRWELDFYGSLSSNILSGNVLRNDIIIGDNNSDQFIDGGSEYDVALSLRNVFSLTSGQSIIYTTTTRFGSGEPAQLDITPPTGSIGNLPATILGTNITVTWSATDASGIKNYDVFVSVNGGAFTPWQTDVTTTSAVYIGEIGKTYTFYSLATDNAGNEQLAANAPQATTQLINPITLAISPISVNEDGVPNLVYTFTRTGSTTNALTINYNVGGTATFNTDYVQTGATSFTNTTGTITFAAGSNTATLTINPTADTSIEGNETVSLTLTSGTGYTIGTTTAVTGTILDDEPGSITGLKWNDLNGNGIREDLIQGNPPDIVFVIDVSGSTSLDFQGLSVGDINNDGTANTRLDAELAGFIALNNRLVEKGLGNTAKVSIVTFESIASQLDMNPALSGVQLATNAATDSNNNGVKDVEELLRSLIAGGGTNFEIALQKATNTLTSLGTTAGNGNVIFMSDGEVNEGGSYNDEVLNLNNAGVKLSAFGVGQDASLSNLQIIDPNASIFTSTDQLLAVFDGLGSGTQSFKEPGLAGVTIYLDLNNNGVLDPNEPTQITATDNPNTTNIDETGQYSFTNLALGTYIVREVIPTGYSQTFPNSPAFHTVVIGSGQTVNNINFGNTTPTSITLAVSPNSVTEDGSSNLIYTFTRTGNLTNTLTVNYGVGGTATFNTDYTQTGAGTFNATAGTVTFAAGFSTATVTIDPKVDATLESNETVVLTLSTGTNYILGTTTAVTGTIIDDDLATITLAVSPSSVTENGAPNLVYTFTRTGATTNALTVNFNVGGTATFSNDYTQTGSSNFSSTSGKVTFAVGSATAEIIINPKGETSEVESDETVIFTLASGTGYTIGTTSAVTGTIIDDEPPPITLAVNPASVTEDGTPNLVYTFTRTGSIASDLTVNFNVGGTATLGTDYIQTGASNFSSTTGKVTFVAGSATADVVVNPKGETTEAEPNETVIFTLASGTGYTIGTTTAVTGTIIDDEPPLITLAVSPSSVTENGAPNLVYTFTRTGLTTSDLTVNFNVGGTATFSTDYTQTGSSNFNGTSGKVTFAAGSATAEVEINPKGETTEVEADETVVLTLASGTGYSIGTTTAVTGTILNDDFPDLSINDITVVEGKDTKAFLTVSVSSPLSQPISVKYTTTPINATANTDYTTTTGTLTLAANATLGTIAIPLLNDNLNEPDEAFTVTLSNPVNANLGPDSIGEVIISDTWQSTITRTLPKDVENLKLIGNNAINGTGNTANNVLTGNSADNTLAGLEGDDTYAFAANSPLGVDTITETLAGGIDTLDFTDTNAAIRLNLGSSTNQTVVTGNLTLKLSAIDVIENARGGSGNDRITGNSLKNSLFGNGGNDTLNGGLDDDYLAGMTGDDLLSGASGKDSFAYVTAKTFLAGDIGLDTLTDFTPTTDKVILSKATFKALTSGVGNGFSQGSDFAVVEDDALAATSTAFMVYSSNSGSLFYNQNGSASGLGTGAEFAVLSGIPTLTGNDFTLVA